MIRFASSKHASGIGGSCGRLTALDASHWTPPQSLGLGVHFIWGDTWSDALRSYDFAPLSWMTLSMFAVTKLILCSAA